MKEAADEEGGQIFDRPSPGSKIFEIYFILFPISQKLYKFLKHLVPQFHQLLHQ